MKFRFDNGVEVIMSPYSDNFGQTWEESLVCYPVLGDWELVIGFDVDEKKPVAEWAINYIGHNRIVANGVLDVVDWAAGYGHKLGTQTVGQMLPDKGLYIERVWECMQANEKVDIAGEACWEISERIDQLSHTIADYQVADSVHERALGEREALRDDLEKAKKEQEAAQAEHERLYGKDPTFEQID